MGKPKAPAPPDPNKTAAAQTGSNVTTALANRKLADINQYGPDGSVTYSESGGQKYTDPSSGATYYIPTINQTTTLSPQQQAIKAQNDRTQLNLGSLAANQSAKLDSYLSKPFSLSSVPGGDYASKGDLSSLPKLNLGNDATEARLIELGRQRLDPLLSQRSEDLRTRLANQGIKAGSEAYSREMQTNDQAANDALNQLILTGHGEAFKEGLGARQEQVSEAQALRQQALAARRQAVQEALANRNQPINEIASLLGRSQVRTPTFAAGISGSTPIQGVDYGSLISNDYNRRLAAYKEKVKNNPMNVLMQLGSDSITGV